MPAPERALVLWCPDWPVLAFARSENADRAAKADSPIALVEANRVVACSASARAEGVRRGQRRRDAQSRCPSLKIVRHDEALDHRAFWPIVDRLEEVVPGVQVIRPGLVAIRARGPARYYGGELPAALTLLGILGELGIPGPRAGIADGPFTAEQAARRGSPVLIVPRGGSAGFLAPLPVSALGHPELAGLLQRLGIRTLGEFARLENADVRDRFGEEGARFHSLASGLDERFVVPRTPPAHLDREVDFEPPLELVDQVTFGMRVAADEFVAALAGAHLVCTSLGIEAVTEHGERSERVWSHPRSFTPAEVVDRVRWQLQGTAPGGSGLRSAIARVRLFPESVDDIARHEQGLWGSGPEERIHNTLSRVQSMLGHKGVLTATVGGGRTLADRQTLVPWGERARTARDVAQPWPGTLPPPVPATVFPAPRPVLVQGPDGETVRVDERGRVSAPPTMLAIAEAARDSAAAPVRQVAGWAGPWPVQERWWDPKQRRSLHRFQVVDDSGTAWLLVLRRGSWWAEARYD